MSQEKDSLDAILQKMEDLHKIFSDVAHETRRWITPAGGKNMLSFCISITRHVASQEEELARQAATIAALEKRLSQLESESRVRPLEGKNPLKGPFPDAPK